MIEFWGSRDVACKMRSVPGIKMRFTSRVEKDQPELGMYKVILNKEYLVPIYVNPNRDSMFASQCVDERAESSSAEVGDVQSDRSRGRPITAGKPREDKRTEGKAEDKGAGKGK